MPHQTIQSWYTGRWWVGCYIWYDEEGTGRGPSPPTGRGPSPPRPLLAVPNVTATHQQPVYQSLYCSIMIRCSAVLIWVKGLNCLPSCIHAWVTIASIMYALSPTKSPIATLFTITQQLFAARRYAWRGAAFAIVRCLSVGLFVCLSRSCIVSKREPSYFYTSVRHYDTYHVPDLCPIREAVRCIHSSVIKLVNAIFLEKRMSRIWCQFHGTRI